MVLFTTSVRVLEVGIKAFVHELGHLVHSIGLDIIHEFLQAGLHAETEALLKINKMPSDLEKRSTVHIRFSASTVTHTESLYQSIYLTETQTHNTRNFTP